MSIIVSEGSSLCVDACQNLDGENMGQGLLCGDSQTLACSPWEMHATLGLLVWFELAEAYGLR